MVRPEHNVHSSRSDLTLASGRRGAPIDPPVLPNRFPLGAVLIRRRELTHQDGSTHPEIRGNQGAKAQTRLGKGEDRGWHIKAYTGGHGG